MYTWLRSPGSSDIQTGVRGGGWWRGGRCSDPTQGGRDLESTEQRGPRDLDVLVPSDIVTMASHFAFVGMFNHLQKEQQCGARSHHSLRLEEKSVLLIPSLWEVLLFCSL